MKAFEMEMVEHLFEFSPRHAQALGKERVLRLVRLGFDRAKRHGFTKRGPVRFFLEMIVMFGTDFDTDPQTQWAANILDDKALDQMARADRLHEQTMEYLDQVVGHDNEYYIAALQRMKALAGMDVKFGPDWFPKRLIRELKQVYSLKCNYLGESSLKILAEQGYDFARKNGIETARELAAAVFLMFWFGYGCWSDLQFPWIGKILTDPGPTDPNQKMHKIERKALIYLDKVLSRTRG